jgi:hypothetical protein
MRWSVMPMACGFWGPWEGECDIGFLGRSHPRLDVKATLARQRVLYTMVVQNLSR